MVKITASRNKLSYTIAEAVTEAMNGECYRDGELERINERLSNHAEFVGQLVQVLVESGGVIRRDHLENLLGYQFKVSAE